MRHQYLLSDLDGTITDPKEGITKSAQYALEAFGIHEPDADKLTPFIGPCRSDSFRNSYYAARAGGACGEEVPRAV